MFCELSDKYVSQENAWKFRVSGCRLEGFLRCVQFPSVLGFIFKSKFIFETRKRHFNSQNFSPMHVINAEQTFTMLLPKNVAWQGSLQKEQYFFHALSS